MCDIGCLSILQCSFTYLNPFGQRGVHVSESETALLILYTKQSTFRTAKYLWISLFGGLDIIEDCTLCMWLNMSHAMCMGFLKAIMNTGLPALYIKMSINNKIIGTCWNWKPVLGHSLHSLIMSCQCSTTTVIQLPALTCTWQPLTVRALVYAQSHGPFDSIQWLHGLLSFASENIECV